MTSNFDPKLNFELEKKYILFKLDPIWSEYRAEFEFRASSKIEIGKKLQIMTSKFELKLNLELDNK